MAVPKTPVRVEQVSGNPVLTAAAQAAPPAVRPASMAASAAIYKHGKKSNPQTDRNQIAKYWQIEAYRHVNICGEARYAATLFANVAARAEIGVSQPNALGRKAVWVTSGPEVDAFNELVPSVRERSKLIRDYMLHRTIAGECYLIARERVDTDPGYEPPPEGYNTWKEAIEATAAEMDILDPEFDPEEWVTEDPNITNPIWEIVAVTEIQKTGDNNWEVRHDNHNWLKLKSDDPVIRLWNPDPEDRREAWSPYRSLLPTLREIEWLTKHIFTQVRSRLMSAGVWFLPDNLTFPPPPPDSVEGGEETIAQMNEAEQFMLSMASVGMQQLDDDEVSFPNVVMADPLALANIDQDKLIQFWSDIDDKAMLLRSDAVRRFSLGMDLPPEQILGSSGIAVSGSAGSAGSVNHWGVWANEEQTISAHIEPALDDLVAVLTTSYLRTAVPETELVIGYDTATLRLRQDRSKEAIELHDRGLLNAKVTVREVGFDPENDMMDDTEFKRWILTQLAKGAASPEMVQAAIALLTNVDLPIEPSGGDAAPELPGSARRSLEAHPYEGPPRVDHEHNDAPFSVAAAQAELLVLRALEKSGNRLLNDGKRGRDRDRETPPHLAHLNADLKKTYCAADFDFSLVSTVQFSVGGAVKQVRLLAALGNYCARLYNEHEGYSRDTLSEVLAAL